MDFVGHGKSTHLTSQGRYSFRTYIGHVVHFITSGLAWDSCVLMGHSMGGHVGAYVAGVIPSIVRSLILLDGPAYTAPTDDFPSLLESALAHEGERAASSLASRPRVYPQRADMAARLVAALEARAAIRAKAKGRNPPPPVLSHESALILMARGAIPVPQGGFCFAHDPRLKAPTGEALSADMLQAFTSRVHGPVLQIASANGTFESGVSRLSHALDAEIFALPLSHHPHLDAPKDVAKLILEFLFKHASDLDFLSLSSSL